MLSYCAYADCRNKYVPCSQTTFFRLPNDDRRATWIDRSGNPSLKDIKPTTSKTFCEKHFDPKYLIRQFHRTVLRRDAIPYHYKEADYYVELIEEAASTSLDDLEGATITSTKSDVLPEESLKDPNDTSEMIYDLARHQLEKSDILQSQKDLQDYVDIAELLEENDESNAETNCDVLVEQIECEETGEISEPKLSVVAEDETVEEIQTIVNREPPAKKCKMVADKQDDESAYVYDEDRHFALSLLGYFRRLSPKTKAIAKLKILQFLTELEFENTSEALTQL